MDPISFAAATMLEPGTAAGQFTARVSPDWTIGGKPNGGYLLAMLGRAAVAIGTHPHVLAASAHYLHSPEPGPVTIDAETLRAGRSASQVRARMVQDGQPCVEALFTTSLLEAGTKPHWDAGMPRPGSSPRQDCLRLPGHAPNGLAVTIMDQVDLRLEAATAGFAAGRPAGLGELRGWLELLGDEPFDPIALLYAVDALPPATFDIEMTGWVPTLQLNVYVRALPVPGPVQLTQTAQLIEGGLVDEDCFVWDSDGRLVAQSTQLAGIRLP